jgi:flagellar protein FlaG
MTSIQVQTTVQPAPPDPAAEPPRSRQEASLPPVSLPAEPKKPEPKPVSGVPASQQPGAQAQRLAVQKAAEQIDRKLAESFSDLRITIDESLNRPVVRVVDSNSGELVRQVPSEEALRIAKRLDALSGLLIRDKA